jgi:predicted  nucleic acid-binding Zn-ribbon protein
LRQYDEELKALEKRKRELEKKVEDSSLERKKLEDSIVLVERDTKKIADQLQGLVLANPWINDCRK